jgi:hypothetical protein
MKTAYYSETSVSFQRNTWRYTPEDRTLHNYRCENLKSYMCIIFTCFCLQFSELNKALIFKFLSDFLIGNVGGRVVGWGTMLQAGRLRVRFPMSLLDIQLT